MAADSCPHVCFLFNQRSLLTKSKYVFIDLACMNPPPPHPRRPFAVVRCAHFMTPCCPPGGVIGISTAIVAYSMKSSQQSPPCFWPWCNAGAPCRRRDDTVPLSITGVPCWSFHSSYTGCVGRMLSKTVTERSVRHYVWVTVFTFPLQVCHSLTDILQTTLTAIFCLE